MSKIFKFGEEVEGYKIPVLNEREVRAAAGILFLMMFISILEVLYKGNFTWLKFAVVIFLTDILIRVLINPRFSPSLIIGRLIVRNQTPEYVGAKQKLFAWVIEIILALTMFVLLVVVNSYLRDLHRFGFDSVAALSSKATKIIEEAAAVIAQYPEVAAA